MALAEFLIAIYMASVIKVHDGDTITVQRQDDSKEVVNIRLNRIDAPELKQTYGRESRDFLNNMIFGEIVDVDVQGHDLYGRDVAELRYDDVNVNSEMVINGMAWRYVKYDRDKGTQLPILEKDARDLKRGLWIYPDPKAPWVFRKEQKQKHKHNLHKLEPKTDESERLAPSPSGQNKGDKNHNI